LRASFRGIVIAPIMAAVVATTAPSRAADENAGGAAAAESLFQDGRRLMEAKRYGEACPKFAASQRIAPAVGTLLNLADCYEKNDQLASAWARFHEAIALAQRLGRRQREQTARERADRLEPMLIRLSILTRSSGVEVKLDGNLVERAALSTPIPVDAGKHTIEATAKGKKPFSKVIDLTDKAKTPTVEIPVLEDEPVAAPSAGEAAHEDPGAIVVTPPPQEKPKGSWTGRKTLAVIVGGLGAVGVGVGAYYGLRAESTWHDTLGYCNADYACSDPGIDLAAQSKRFASYSTIGFAAGGALVAGGVILFLTAPRPKTAAAAVLSHVAVGRGSILVGGQF
jgi:hypothetical protein